MVLPLIDAALGVRHAARAEDGLARPEPERLVAALNDVLALDDVEELVLAAVNVQRRVDHRRDFLDDGDGAAGVLGTNPDHDRHLAEGEPLLTHG